MSSTCCGIFLFKCSRGAGRCYLTTWKAAGTRRTFRNISSSALWSGGETSTVTTKKQMLSEISSFVFFTDIYLQAWFLSGMLFTTRPLTTSQFLWRISRETSWWTGKGWSLSLPLLHNQDDDHHHCPQVRLRGGRLRPLLGAQRAHLPRRREVPRQGSSCPRLQVSLIVFVFIVAGDVIFLTVNIIFASVQRISNPQGCHRVCWKATSSSWLKLLCRRHRSSMSQVFQLITILTIENPS